MGAEKCMYIYISFHIVTITWRVPFFVQKVWLWYWFYTTRGVMHSLFVRGTSWGEGGSHVTHSNHNSTYVLFIFSFLFKTFPYALTISWNILILTFIESALASTLLNAKMRNRTPYSLVGLTDTCTRRPLKVCKIASAHEVFHLGQGQAETQDTCVLCCLWTLKSVKWRKHKDLLLCTKMCCS